MAAPRWSVLTTEGRGRTNSFSNAYAVAAAREETPIFRNVFWTWRATVGSLMTSVDAMSRLVFPAATRRSTWSSRWDSPCAPLFSPGESREIRRRPQPIEDLPRRLQLEPGSLVVAEVGTGTRDEQPGACDLVPERRARTRPAEHRAAARARRGRRPQRRKPRPVHARPSHRASRSRSARRVPRTRRTASRASQAGACCECDLDVRRKQRGARVKQLLSLCTHSTDGGERGVVLPLSEPKLREAGLRLPAQIARLTDRPLGFLEPTEQPEHLALTVVREPRHHAQRIEARACESRLFERVVPGAVELASARSDGSGNGR